MASVRNVTQLDAQKCKVFFEKCTKHTHFTEEVNSSYSHALGLLRSKSPREARNQCFPKFKKLPMDRPHLNYYDQLYDDKALRY